MIPVQHFHLKLTKPHYVSRHISEPFFSMSLAPWLFRGFQIVDAAVRGTDKRFCFATDGCEWRRMKQFHSRLQKYMPDSHAFMTIPIGRGLGHVHFGQHMGDDAILMGQFHARVFFTPRSTPSAGKNSRFMSMYCCTCYCCTTLCWFSIVCATLPFRPVVISVPPDKPGN